MVAKMTLDFTPMVRPLSKSPSRRTNVSVGWKNDLVVKYTIQTCVQTMKTSCKVPLQTVIRKKRNL